MTAADIKTLRRSVAMSQMQFAVLLSTTPTTISRWERGTCPIPPLTADGIRARVAAERRRANR